MVRVGAKYQTFDDDYRVIWRVIRVRDSGSAIVYNLATHDTTKMSIKDIEDSMVEITPDALIDFMITAYEDGNKDIYACVYRTDAIISDVSKPAVILRQDVYSYTKNPLAIDGKIYVGDCMTQYIMPGDEDIMSVAEFNEVLHNFTISIYSDDTIDDILRCLPTDEQIRFNSVLEEMSKRNNDQVTGYCDNIKQLMTENRFIDCYRSIFNIIQVDFPIILGKESFNNDGDIILNNKQKKRIEDLLRKYITDIKVIAYDYDIDVKDIIVYKHILISDEKQKIFLIAYKEVGDYPVDDDIAKGMGITQ